MQIDAQVPPPPPQPARWIERAVAEVLEYLAWGAALLLLLFSIILGASISDNLAVQRIFIVLGVALLVGAWLFLILQYRDGRSFGKRIVGIRVVRADGQPPSWAYNYIVRTLLIKWLLIGVVSEITLGVFLLLNYLWPLWDGKRQALHDRTVDTFVVKAERGKPGALAP